MDVFLRIGNSLGPKPIVKIAQQDGSLHQGEVHLANQISSQLQGDEASDQIAAMTVIEAMPYYDQVLYSMQ